MTSPSAHFLALRALLDQGDLLLPDSGLEAYQRPARGAEGLAACVLRPRTPGEVSRLISYCIGRGVRLVVQSGNTGLVGDSTPDNSGEEVVLSLEKLRGSFEFNALNRSLRVSAGYRMSEINSRLEDEGVFLPIDLGADPMVGGLVATNTGGSRLLRYGGVREQVLALQVALARKDGQILELGSACRKDNSAPDWKQIFIGSGAAFGIVTECTFELTRRPAIREAVLLAPRDDAAIDQILMAMEARMGSRLSAFESMSMNAVRHAIKHVPGLKPPFVGGEIPGQVLLVEVSQDWPETESAPRLADELLSVVEDIWSFPDGPLLDARFGRHADLWTLRHAISEGLRAAGDIVAFDLSFSRDRVNRFRATARKQAASLFPMLQLCDFGHVGDGGVHLNFVAPRGIVNGELRQEIEDWAYQLAVREFGGSFSAEHGVGRKNQRVYDTFTDPELKELSRQFKAAVVPGRIGAFQP